MARCTANNNDNNSNRNNTITVCTEMVRGPFIKRRLVSAVWDTDERFSECCPFRATGTQRELSYMNCHTRWMEDPSGPYVAGLCSKHQERQHDQETIPSQCHGHRSGPSHLILLTMLKCQEIQGARIKGELQSHSKSSFW